MSEQQLTDLLERAAQKAPVGPPPLAAIASRSRRRRASTRVTVAAGTAAALAAVAAPAVLLSHRPAAPAARPTATSPTASPSRVSGPPPATARVRIVGRWRLVALVGPDGTSAMPAGSEPVTITFDTRGVTADDGCNDHSAFYHRSGPQGRDLRFSQFTVTLVGCLGQPTPPDLDLLSRTRHVSQSSPDDLTLHAASWMIVAQLRRVPDPRGDG